MVAEVEEDFLYLEHPAHAVEGGHVALQHLVHDVLAQQALAACQVVDQRRFGEAAAQEVFVKMGGERPTQRGRAGKITRRLIKEMAQGSDLRQGGNLHLPQAQVFRE
jgi:hypothetical protein